MYNFTAFTNEGPVTNSGTFIVNGYPTKESGSRAPKVRSAATPS